MKVLTFSRTFPKHHARASEPTYFVQRIKQSIFGKSDKNEIWHPKHHTIRAGHRWKVGDKASLRVWEKDGGRFAKGNKQIEFAEVEIKKVWDFELEKLNKYSILCLSIQDYHYPITSHPIHSGLIKKIAQNDGLELADFISWFHLGRYIIPSFAGQIICWADEVNYD